MSIFANKTSVASRLTRWRNSWRKSGTALAELDQCGAAEVKRIAHDVGLNANDLRVLAGKWPDAADLLMQRMQQLSLDEAAVAHTDPLVMRDLQRACSLCGNKRRCEHDLIQAPSDPAWQGYCPNEPTLSALLRQKRK